MPEDLAGQAVIDPASASDTPVDEAPDIEKIRQEAIAAANAAAEERIKGFQRLVAERDTTLTALQRQLDEANLSTLSEDEKEAELARRTDQEMERLRAENELLKLMPAYPDELPLFQRLLAAPDAKTQLELLREIRGGAKAPANPPAAGSSTDPAAVDPNNPASDTPGGGVFIEGMPMTEDLAQRILSGVSRMR